MGNNKENSLKNASQSFQFVFEARVPYEGPFSMLVPFGARPIGAVEKVEYKSGKGPEAPFLSFLAYHASPMEYNKEDFFALPSAGALTLPGGENWVHVATLLAVNPIYYFRKY